MRILLVFSSRPGDLVAPGLVDPPIESYATPYFILRDAGAEMVLATTMGGFPPVGPSAPEGPVAALVRRYRRDRTAREEFGDTLRLDQVWADDFDAIYVGGGHGALLDLAASTGAGRLVAHFAANDRPVALVGHGVAALLTARDAAGGPVAAGRQVTAPSNAEEAASGATAPLPIRLQDALAALGARYGCAGPGEPHVVRDQRLITAQNAASAGSAARLLLDLLRNGSGIA